jgi:hypothetical protein
LKDAANAKNEEADMKQQEAAEKRAAADQKQKDAIAKRAAADTKQQDADMKQAKAQKTRDSMLGSITDVKTKKKAQLLADAAITGGNVTKVKATITATNEIAACADAYLNMGIKGSVGLCEVNDVISVALGRRHLLVDTAYRVEILLSSTEVNQSSIDAALTSLSVAGITAETTKEDALVLLSTIPGIGIAILTTLRSEATAAAAAIGSAVAAKADAAATESAAAKLEINAAAAEKAAVDLAVEATTLGNEAAAAAAMLEPTPSVTSPPPPLPPPPLPLPEPVLPVDEKTSSSGTATRSSWALQWMVLCLFLWL